MNLVLRPDADLSCICDNPFGVVPEGVPIIDPGQEWRWTTDDTLPIYQIGNNADHVDIYRRALEQPGLVILHDLRLFYLHELMDLPAHRFAAMMLASNPIMAPARIDDVTGHRRKIGSDYFCFDMIGDLLHRSRLIMVHSHYARNILIRTHGALAAERVAVVPHFALEPADSEPAAIRRRLAIPRATTLIVTSGFATKAKRFDWIAPALAELVAAGYDIQWIHAGAERTLEYDLSGLIAEYPALQGRSAITGFLSEADLDDHLMAADVVLNLRYPSVGESSGTLARALASGKCCVVTRTGAYDELPDSVVAKVSPLDSVIGLERTLRGLLEIPQARESFGRNARQFARGTLSLDSYGKALLDLCARAITMDPAADTALLNAPPGRDRLTLGPFAADVTSPVDLAGMVPATFMPQGLRMRRDGKGGLLLDAVGLDVGRSRGARAG